eukprot:TRINITY_DN32909_c0_g1_i1.p2 TRINITY_DN32909_c0_g1~~TRINITY_DN32909_c0_g1_i1.p2  ORF type:complete len:122 (-),score=11.13 TRINITY_DN32909_c0_g1_i1:13-378(-)
MCKTLPANMWSSLAFSTAALADWELAPVETVLTSTTSPWSSRITSGRIIDLPSCPRIAIDPSANTSTLTPLETAAWVAASTSTKLAALSAQAEAHRAVIRAMRLPAVKLTTARDTIELTFQ